MDGKMVFLVLNAFVDFDCYATADHFIDIYGKRMGEHLWDKFTNDYSRDIAKSYLNMDNGNRQKLCDYLVKHEEEKEYDAEFTQAYNGAREEGLKHKAAIEYALDGTAHFKLCGRIPARCKHA